MYKKILTTTGCFLALATGSASGAGGNLPPGWTHAEINYFVNRVPHTLVLDRGLVTAVSASALTLREQDGTPVQISLSPSTQVVVDGRPGQLSDIRRRVMAVVQRIDGGSATRVQVHIPPRLR